MKKYKMYIDDIQTSNTFHQRLVELEAPKKHPAVWKKYGGMAAALVLAVGVGAWGLSGGFPFAAGRDTPLETTLPEIVGVPQPDIAVVEPGESLEPGEPTLGGYEVVYGSGPNSVTAYHILPYIEYGAADGQAMAADWDVPYGATRRDLSRDEIIALMGGADAVADHLDWGGYELSGWAAWYENGAFWGAYLFGEEILYGGPGNSFEFAVTAGQLPPTCFGYPSSVTQEIRGLTVTADKADWEHELGGRQVRVSDRRVSFMKGDSGYRFEMRSGDPELAEKMVSRLVARVADRGLALDAVTSDGAVLAHPWEAEPNSGVGEPRWDDSVDDFDSDCPY